MQRDDAAIVDMLDFARDILVFTAGLDERAFAASRVAQAAVLHRLMLLGEAVRRVSDQACLAHPEIPWKGVSGQRNVLIHDYDEVELQWVWMVVDNDIPALIAVLEPIVSGIERGLSHSTLD